jgi:putative PIN family toxin of toxin-antitoxin system
MRVVLDNNVILSGLFWKGAPRALLDSAVAGRFQAVVSPSLLVELEDVLREDFELPEGPLREAMSFVLSFAEVVEDGGASPVAVRDPGDEKVLACAVRGGADVIVTGDRDLLDLPEPAGIRILKPRAFLEVIAG